MSARKLLIICLFLLLPTSALALMGAGASNATLATNNASTLESSPNDGVRSYGGRLYVVDVNGGNLRAIR